MRSTCTLVLAALATLAVAKHGTDKPKNMGQWDGQQHGPPAGWKGGPPMGMKGGPPPGAQGWFGGFGSGGKPPGNWGGDKNGKPSGIPGIPKIPGAHMPIPMNALPGHGKPTAGNHMKYHMAARDVEEDDEDEENEDDEEFSELAARDVDDNGDEEAAEGFENEDAYDDQGNVIDKRNAYMPPAHWDMHQKNYVGPPAGQNWAQHKGSWGKDNGHWNLQHLPRDVEPFENEDFYDDEGNVIDDDSAANVMAREVDVDSEDATNGDQSYYDFGDEGDEGDFDPSYGTEEESTLEARDAKKKPAPPKKKGWGSFPW